MPLAPRPPVHVPTTLLGSIVVHRQGEGVLAKFDRFPLTEDEQRMVGEAVEGAMIDSMPVYAKRNAQTVDALKRLTTYQDRAKEQILRDHPEITRKELDDVDPTH